MWLAIQALRNEVYNFPKLTNARMHALQEDVRKSIPCMELIQVPNPMLGWFWSGRRERVLFKLKNQKTQIKSKDKQ